MTCAAATRGCAASRRSGSSQRSVAAALARLLTDQPAPSLPLAASSRVVCWCCRRQGERRQCRVWLRVARSSYTCLAALLRLRSRSAAAAPDFTASTSTCLLACSPPLRVVPCVSTADLQDQVRAVPHRICRRGAQAGSQPGWSLRPHLRPGGRLQVRRLVCHLCAGSDPDMLSHSSSSSSSAGSGSGAAMLARSWRVCSGAAALAPSFSRVLRTTGSGGPAAEAAALCWRGGPFSSIGMGRAIPAQPSSPMPLSAYLGTAVFASCAASPAAATARRTLRRA